MRERFNRTSRIALEWHTLWWPGLRPLAFGSAFCVLWLLSFALMADEVVEDGRDRYDRVLQAAVHDVTQPAFVGALRFVTEFGSTFATAAVCLFLAGWLVSRHRPLAAVLTFAAWGSGQVVVQVIKSLLHRARPDLFPPLVHADGYSFPSGHTFSTVVAYGLLAAVIAAQLRGRARYVPWVAWVCVVGSIGYSRISLGAHYPSDVLGSVLLGGAWLQASLMVMELTENPHRFLPRHMHRRIPARS